MRQFEAGFYRSCVGPTGRERAVRYPQGRMNPGKVREIGLLPLSEESHCRERLYGRIAAIGVVLAEALRELGNAFDRGSTWRGPNGVECLTDSVARRETRG